MVPATLTSRSPRRVAGLLIAAGAVLGPIGGAYADGRTARDAPHRPAGSPPAAMSSVTRVAAHGTREPRTVRVAITPAAETSADEPGADGAGVEEPGAGGPGAGKPGSEGAEAARQGVEPPRVPADDTPRTSTPTPPAGPPGTRPALPVRPSPARPSATLPAHLSPLAAAALPPGNGPLAPSRPSAPSPSKSPSGSADASPLAGRQAGEGRTRPGRSLSPLDIARSEAALEKNEPVADDDADTDAVPAATPPPGAFPEPGRTATRQALDGAAVRRVQQMFLGAGITLVGLGLGFLGFRMRRTR